MFSNYMAITDKTTLQFVFHYKQCKYDNEPKVDWKVDWHRRSLRESDCQWFPSGIIYNLYCLVTALLSKDLLLRCKCVRNKDTASYSSKFAILWNKWTKMNCNVTYSSVRVTRANKAKMNWSKIFPRDNSHDFEFFCTSLE